MFLCYANCPPQSLMIFFCCRFIYVPAPHTADVITDVLHEVLLDWHIERNLSTITLDNCSVNDNLMKNMIGTDGDDLAKNKTTMEGKLPLPSCMLKGKLIHMRCAAHILNLIVKDGMSVMEKGIDKVRDSVAYWSATPKRHEKFEKMAAQMKGKKKLLLTVKLDGTQLISCLILLYPIGRFSNAWVSLIGTMFVHHQMIGLLVQFMRN